MKTLDVSVLIDDLSVKDLNQLKLNIIACLNHQRAHWVNNPNNRTEHLKHLIIETREELNQILNKLKRK